MGTRSEAQNGDVWSSFLGTFKRGGYPQPSLMVGQARTNLGVILSRRAMDIRTIGQA